MNKELWNKCVDFHGHECPADEVFKIEEIEVDLPEKARRFDTVVCQECHEGASENKIRIQDQGKFQVFSIYNPTTYFVVSLLALLANIAVFAYMVYKVKKTKKHPYKEELYVDLKAHKEVKNFGMFSSVLSTSKN